MTLLQHLCNLFHQHEFVKKVNGKRLYLECLQCGLETQGLSLVPRLTPKDIEEAHEAYLESELRLLGGG